MAEDDPIVKYLPIIVIMVVGLCIWIYVFQLAAVDYLANGSWNHMSAWLGPISQPGEFDLFGMTIYYQFEGYSDHSFFYQHWGHNVLNGVLPYRPEFGYLERDGVVNENGIFIFPPLYAMICATGAFLHPYLGIGVLLSAFGYLTALPVYGIAKEFSQNRHVGEVAALTYLLSPLVLYYVDYIWLNPSPFMFFFFSGFYLLIRGKRHWGTLAIVTAALIKQTAWFLGIPLVIYLLVRSRKPGEDVRVEAGLDAEGKLKKSHDDFISIISRVFDLPRFTKSVILVVAFAGAILLPFFLAQPNMIDYILLAGGGFRLDSFTELPGYGSPMRFQVLPVVLGLPELAELLDFLIFNSFILWFGVAVFAVLMLLEPKKSDKQVVYLRRLLFITMLLMFWVHLMGPRGVYKYYFALFAPFFSIFSSTGMVTGKSETVRFSPSMLIMPVLFSALIFIPPRNIYFFFVILIFVCYVAIALWDTGGDKTKSFLHRRVSAAGLRRKRHQQKPIETLHGETHYTSQK